MKFLILKSNFTLHQKIALVLIFIFTFLVGITYWSILIFEEINISELQIGDYLAFLFLPLSFLALLHLLSKDGLIINQKKLFKSKFIFGKPWSKKSIELKNMTDISILTSNGTQKFTFATAGNPDKGYQTISYNMYLLNENHTIKNLLISTNSKQLAEETVELLTENLNINYSKYNPRFPNRGRRR